MLCNSCDSERHRMFLESKNNNGIASYGTTMSDEVVSKSTDFVVGDERSKSQNKTRSVRTESSADPVKVHSRALETSASTSTTTVAPRYNAHQCNAHSDITRIRRGPEFYALQ